MKKTINLNFALLLFALILIGCNPKESINTPSSDPLNSTESTSQPVQNKSAAPENIFADFRQSQLEDAIKRYGKNKVEIFIKECKLKNPGTEFHDIHLRPPVNCSPDCQATSRIFQEASFESAYGHKTELAVDVSKKQRNRFHEEYDVVSTCRFLGPPTWEMLISPQEVDASFSKNRPQEPSLIEPASIPAFVNMECSADSDCRVGFSCRSKSGGGTMCKLIE